MKGELDCGPYSQAISSRTMEGRRVTAEFLEKYAVILIEQRRNEEH